MRWGIACKSLIRLFSSYCFYPFSDYSQERQFTLRAAAVFQRQLAGHLSGNPRLATAFQAAAPHQAANASIRI